jgi:hypothetical protein
MANKGQIVTGSDECVVMLTDTHSLGIVDFVARLKDIIGGLHRRAGRQATELSKGLAEQRELIEACQRLRDLATWLKPQQESWRICTALVLNAPQKDKASAEADFDHEFPPEPDLNEPYLSAEEIKLSHYPLWKIIREIVRQAVDLRVYELQTHLKAFGIDTTRSAIESALLTHKEEFKITRYGREKFVSLKGVEDAPATTRKRK